MSDVRPGRRRLVSPHLAHATMLAGHRPVVEVAMTKRQYQDLQRYVNRIAPLLGIAHWRLEVVEDQPENQNWLACCISYDGQTRAELAFREDFIDCDPRDQVGTILHELLHVVYAQPQTLIRTQPDETLDRCWRNAQEYSTDALARGLAPLFPLVEWR